MKGNGNSFGTLFRKLLFFVLPSSGLRTKYIYKNEKLFHHVGEKLFWQPRKFPADPEYISIGNNVKIAADVVFVNHDVISDMLNHKYGVNEFVPTRGCIEIGNNVMIGMGVRVLPNVRIGDNVIIGAGAIVARDIPSNCIAAGVPCKVIGDFEQFVEKRKKNVEDMIDEELWNAFYAQRD